MDITLQNTPAQLSATWYEAGVVVDPGAVTIKVDRDDATNLIPAGTATLGTGANARTYNLTAANTALLDRLTAVWTSPTKGTLTTEVEVVGGFVCSIADIDFALNKGGTAADYPLDQKLQARQVATEAFERECGVAFTPRYARKTLTVEGGLHLPLPTPRVLSVQAVSVDGTALTGTDLTDIAPDEPFGLYRPVGWARGTRNTVVKWTHGHKTPPSDVSRAVGIIAASILADGPFDDRGFAVSDDGFGARLLTAGVGGAAFSIPEVQSTLARYRYVVFA